MFSLRLWVLIGASIVLLLLLIFVCLSHDHHQHEDLLVPDGRVGMITPVSLSSISSFPSGICTSFCSLLAFLT